MARVTTKAQCSICGKQTRTFICGGCSQNFCRNDLIEHLEKLNLDLNKIENDHDQFRENLKEQIDDPKKRSLIQQIDKWEDESIKKIKQTAKVCRDRLINYTDKFLTKIENKLNDIAEELKQIRQENEFNEIDRDQFQENLKELQEELDKIPNVSIEQESSIFINKIFVIIPLDKDTKWKQEGSTIVGENGYGDQLNQLFHPSGIFINDDQHIYITDCHNHRIVESKYNATNGIMTSMQIVAGGNGSGKETNKLDCPTDVIIDKEYNSFIICEYGNRRIMRWSYQNNTNGQIIVRDISCSRLAMDKNGSLYVSDWEKNEVRRWDRGNLNGIIVAGGNGKGDHLNQLNNPTFIFIDEDYSLYVSDTQNHRVMKWIKDANEGIVVAGGNGVGNSLTQLSEPRGIIVDQLCQIYVADFRNDRVMRWFEGAKEGTIVVGGNGRGKQLNQLNGPIGLSFDRQRNLYVADRNNHRIQKFEIN